METNSRPEKEVSTSKQGQYRPRRKDKKEIEIVTFQGKEITLENLSPVFTPEQEAVKRRELEQQLYEVFRKYADKRQKEEAGA